MKIDIEPTVITDINCEINALLSAALGYAAMGWKVIPVKGKVPFIKRWPEVASDDPETINSWWSEQPNLNVGVVTGSRSGIFVLDVDAKYGGTQALEALEHQYGVLPKTLVAQTGGGGFHYIFKYPQGGIGNDTGDLPRGLDVRGGWRSIRCSSQCS